MTVLSRMTFAVLFVVAASPAHAAACGTGSFESWLDKFKTEAAAEGISQKAIT